MQSTPRGIKYKNGKLGSGKVMELWAAVWKTDWTEEKLKGDQI